MRCMRDLIGVNPTEGMYGVEIEVEGKNLPINLGRTWKVEHDGSLKAEEAHEYVTPKPLTLEGVKKSLDFLAEAYRIHGSVIDESIRAGVHVHMNVQDWNIKQLMTFTTSYYILEEVLMNWCGPDREGNLFCLRTRDAEYVLFRLMKTLKTRNLKFLKDDVIRYSSLNYCSLFKYGSIEFRGMRGTGDLDTIYDWVKIIDDLRTSSLKFDSPNDVMAMMSGSGGLDFLEYMLPNTHHLINKVDVDKSVRSAARRVQMIAFAIDWNTIGERGINPFVQEGF